MQFSLCQLLLFKLLLDKLCNAEGVNICTGIALKMSIANNQEETQTVSKCTILSSKYNIFIIFFIY